MSSMATVREATAQYTDQLPAVLKGRVVRLAVFASEEDCRFFYPRRALPFQQQMNTTISREVQRKRKGKVERVFYAPADYFAEVAAKDDSPEARRTWLEHRIGLLP